MGNISHNTGNVGIGVNTPTSLLHLYGANPVLNIQNSFSSPTAGSGGEVVFGHDQNANTIPMASIKASLVDGGGAGARAGDLKFYTSNAGSLTEKMILTKDGRLGIGVASPTVALDVNGKATSASTVFADGGTTLVTKDFLYPATGWIFYNSSLTGSLGSLGEFSSTSAEGAIHTILNGTFRRVSASSNINILLLDGGIGITNSSTGGPTNPRTIARIVMTLPDGNDVTYDYPVSTSINTVYVKRIVLTAAQLVAGFTTVAIQTSSASGQTPPGQAATNNHPAGAGSYVLKTISFYVYGNTSAAGTQVNSGTVIAGGYINDVNGYAQNRVMVIES